MSGLPELSPFLQGKKMFENTLTRPRKVRELPKAQKTLSKPKCQSRYDFCPHSNNKVVDDIAAYFCNEKRPYTCDIKVLFSSEKINFFVIKLMLDNSQY